MVSMNLIEHLKKLHDAQLHEDVKLLGSMLLTMCEHNADLLNPQNKFHLLMCYGDALFALGEIKNAESVFRKALQLKKMMNKCKCKQQQDHSAEVEVKVRLHKCYVDMKQFRDALTVLESISAKTRTPHINLELGKLYQKTGLDRSAAACYKEVLRECPLSLSAAEGLLALDVKAPEVLSLVAPGGPPGGGDWLATWVRGHAHLAAREYSSAVNTFKVLDSPGAGLRDNAALLCQLGRAHFLQGNYTDATRALQRAAASDPLSPAGMDMLAFLLLSRPRELESLSTGLMAAGRAAPQAWVATGYYCMATGRGTKAVYFAQKAYSLDNHNVEALLLKGSALLELKKLREAIMHYREAMRLAPHRYEAHKGLVECYVAGQRFRDAATCAAHAVTQLGTNARSLTLYATTLAKEPTTVEKAKTCLEKALRLEPHCVDAVYLMADILLLQGLHERGVDLLRRQLRHHSTCRLHQLLGDFLQRTNQHQEALDQYSIAYSLDPTNARAKDGLERAEKHGSLGGAAGDVGHGGLEVDDVMEGSDNEGNVDNSDLESAWSDIDLM